jgi:hypothetical protein
VSIARAPVAISVGLTMSELLLHETLQSGSSILVKTGNSMPGPFVGIHDLVMEMPWVSRMLRFV